MTSHQYTNDFTVELANENLLFWREAIKFKMQFDRKSFDYSQENAKVLWRTFISSQAQLPINISASIKRDLDARFKGVVGRSIFDVALMEVYLMMQNGAFQRFIQSKVFADYAKSRADFSLSITSSSLQVAPAIEDDHHVKDGHGSQSIRDYIRSL